ncbi:hypothetical protein EV131_107381 [Rhizobium laguerreae]|uniref:Uncharacterized protein n=1 Tax=Rhizobium laguerreae TaxID=1076926 RepID=A0AAX2QKC4_9HYPH|nr:hypothetical protein EV131_107381 [Rhizobium laguerreae]
MLLIVRSIPMLQSTMPLLGSGGGRVPSKKKQMRVEEIEWYQKRLKVVIVKFIAGGPRRGEVVPARLRCHNIA